MNMSVSCWRGAADDGMLRLIVRLELSSDYCSFWGSLVEENDRFGFTVEYRPYRGRVEEASCVQTAATAARTWRRLRSLESCCGLIQRSHVQTCPASFWLRLSRHQTPLVALTPIPTLHRYVPNQEGMRRLKQCARLALA